MQQLRSSLVLLAALALASCMPLHRDRTPLAVYQLNAPAMPIMAQPPALPAHTVLEVALPSVPPGYDKDRIALSLDNGRRLDYYAGVRWPAPLPEVLQDVVTRTLLTSLPGLSADDEDHVSAPTQRLRVDVLSFTPVYASDAKAPPRVQVTLRFVLTTAGGSAPLADFTLGATQMPAANNVTAITTALEQGLQQVMHDALPRLAGALAPVKTRR